MCVLTRPFSNPVRHRREVGWAASLGIHRQQSSLRSASAIPVGLRQNYGAKAIMSRSDRAEKIEQNFKFIRERSNALKHGVFTPVATLPGEDPREFEALHSALVKEWAPVGPTEEDAVLSIAKAMLRKGRLQKFLRGKALACTLDATHPAYDEVKALRAFSSALEIAPDFLDGPLNCLSEKLKDRLKRQFPPEKFETISARARAIQNEINSAILPSLERCDKPLEMSYLEAAEIVTQDDFKHEIALEERIDAMIDRAVKRLVQAKAMKQMLHTMSLNGGSDHSKSLPSNKGNGSTKKRASGSPSEF